MAGASTTSRATTRRTFDDALIGYIADDDGDVIGVVWAASPEEALRQQNALAMVPTDMVRDITQTDAYKALLAQGVDAVNRAAAADKARNDALQALMAVRAAPRQSAAPIAVNVPSFALGFNRRLQ